MKFAAPVDPLLTFAPEPKYPVAVIDPDPICKRGTLVPLVDNPLNITVTRFTQDGMLRKLTPTTVMVPLTVPVDMGLIV